MRLSDKELKLYSEVGTRLARRKRDAWLYVAAVILLIVLTKKFEVFSALGESSILGWGVGFAVGYLAHVYFAVRPEDKLAELLQRYVNQDPEAVAQLASVRERQEGTEKGRASPTT